MDHLNWSIFRRLKCVHVYECVSHGREWWYTLHLSSDVRFCLKDLQPSKENRRNPYPSWWKYGAGKPYRQVNSHLMNDIVYKPFNAAPMASVVILREKSHKKNLSGGDEMYIPPRLLHGLIPESLLDNYQFWQDESSKGSYKRMRGYAIDQASSYNDFIIILEIDSLNTQETSQFVAQNTKVQCCRSEKV